MIKEKKNNTKCGICNIKLQYLGAHKQVYYCNKCDKVYFKDNGKNNLIFNSINDFNLFYYNLKANDKTRYHRRILFLSDFYSDKQIKKYFAAVSTRDYKALKKLCVCNGTVCPACQIIAIKEKINKIKNW